MTLQQEFQKQKGYPYDLNPATIKEYIGWLENIIKERIINKPQEEQK